MKLNTSVFTALLAIYSLSVVCAARNPDFFYFIQQWPGSVFDTNQNYCYPTGGKPAADFVIAGFQPYYIDGSFPSNCTTKVPYNQSKMMDLISRMQKSWPSLSCPSNNGFSLWSREWKQHGTCSESVLDQHSYFKSALNLKDKVKLLQTLRNAGIKPDGKLYSIDRVMEAIRAEIGYYPGVKCNSDKSGKMQLHEMYICVDTLATKFVECPGLPNFRCTSNIKFAAF